MKTLTREFTNRELVLLLIFGIIIIGLAYYLLVEEPVRNGIASANADRDALQTQVAVIESEVSNMHAWQSEMDLLEENGHPSSYMPSYNSSKEELDFLNTTLAGTLDYYVGFTQITRQGNQIRRSFALNYSATDYNAAVAVIDALENSKIRCLVGDFSMAPYENSASLMAGPVSVTATATFYETMRGGVEDMELPPDTAPKPEIEDAEVTE